MNKDEKRHLTTAEKIAALEVRRAERAAAIADARAERYAADLEAIDSILAAEGDDRVAIMRTPSYVAGLPTLVVVRTPDPAHFTRYRQMVRRAGKDIEKIGTAADMLGACSVAWPDEATYGRMKDAWPSLPDGVSVEVIKLGEAVGKG